MSPLSVRESDARSAEEPVLEADDEDRDKAK